MTSTNTSILAIIMKFFKCPEKNNATCCAFSLNRGSYIQAYIYVTVKHL